MLKLLKSFNKGIFIIISICFLSISSINFVFAEDIPIVPGVANDENQMELIQNDVEVEDAEIEPIDTKSLKKEVIPDPKKEGRRVIELFLRTMFAVFVSAIILYFVLLFVKKFYSKNNSKQTNNEIEKLDLAEPITKQEALKSFLNKSK